MATFEHRTAGDLDAFLSHLDGKVFSGFSGSRVSLNVRVLESAGQLAICAITSYQA